MFPEIYRWSDDVLIVAIGEADARHPAMNLHANARSSPPPPPNYCGGWTPATALSPGRRWPPESSEHGGG